jgi:hypothetical protein
MRNEKATIYAEIPGGPELLAWFGRVPGFHDAEIVQLELNRRRPSKLAIHFWNMLSDTDERGYFILDRHAVVTFTLVDIIDIQLDGFNHQNVLGSLHLLRGPERPDRETLYTSSLTDYEIVLEPCFGTDGRIRCRSLTIALAPGKPDDIR